MPHQQYIVSTGESIRDLMARIDANAKGFAIVTDAEGRLSATITDGDVRRAILAGIDVDESVQRLLDDRARRNPAPPVTARVGTPEPDLLHLMNTAVIRQVPLLDDDGRVADIAFLHDLVKDFELPLRAVIMAGGFGTRLGALTENTPKPMLPIGDRPLLEMLVDQFRRAGIKRVNITTHYKSEVIADHFGDGRGFGVDINYVRENLPLGTAGALSLIEDADEPILVINGDIVTRVDFHSMLDFHREQNADMTIAVRQCEFRVPYGVVECDGARVTDIAEKPVIRHLVNAGIYLLNPDVPRIVPNGQRYDMPDLIAALLDAGRHVVSFPITEYWLDIGQVADYERAQEDAARPGNRHS